MDTAGAAAEFGAVYDEIIVVGNGERRVREEERNVVRG